MPTNAEINKLTAFLPRLYAADFSPIKEWKGGERIETGGITMPYPDYDRVTREFFRAASEPCWVDGRYLQRDAGEMLGDPERVANASLDEVRLMLTWCVRGERFCDGHWDRMIEAGHVRRLLERLVEIRQEGS